MSRQARRLVLFLTILALAVVAVPGWAATSDWVTKDEHRVRVFAPYEVLPRSGEADLGVHFRLARGWHVYWLNPGDAGFPSEFTFPDTPGLRDARTLFPAPHRFIEPGDLIAYGYSDEVVYPVRVTLDAGSASSIDLHAKLTYLICREKCIPYTQELHLGVPVGDAARVDLKESSLLSYWLAQVPPEIDRVPGASARAYLSPDGTTLTLDLEGVRPIAGRAALFPEPSEWFLVGNKPTITPTWTGVRFVTDLTPAGESPAPADAQFGFVFGGLATDQGEVAFRAALAPVRGTPPPVQAGTFLPPRGSANRLPVMLLLGLLGGLILNAMPCVLPVLSLKVFAVVRSAGEGRSAVVRSNLATAAGIVASFWLLAGAAALARQAGLAVGWGVQFQEPAFVTGLGVVVLLFALNLWGLFEIPMPRFASRLGTAGGEGLAGHFATGLFATLLATPCSAPFLGTAVSFSLTQATPVILAVFTALGLGMALPYLALATVPGVARFFPRPGAWMEKVRVAMGFLLAATLVWLLYVLSAQVPATTLAWVELALLGVALLVWLHRAVQTRRLPARLAVLGVVLAAAGAVYLSAAPGTSATPAGGRETVSDAAWTRFDPARAQALVGEGKTVLVNITADWCFTCKALEKTVLADREVVEELDRRGVVRMRGDWTNRNDELARFMAGFGRYGVPFNLLYRPGKPPHLFGEVFTKQTILGVLRESGS